MQPVLEWLTHYGYPVLFSLLMFGIVGLPVPDETLLTFCGFLVYSGRLHFAPSFCAGFAGSVCGITISYVLGLRFGNLVFGRYGRFIGLTTQRLVEIERHFLRYGPLLLAIGYFIPGVRHFTAVVAGMAGLRYSRFAVFAYSGAAIWVATFLTLGYIFGERWKHTSQVVHQYTLIATGVLGVVALLFWMLRRRRN